MFGLFSSIGEVLAPTVKSPQDEFRGNWNSIKRFYWHADQQSDVDGSEVPGNLSEMLRLLLDENTDSPDNAPCLEYFLSEKILEALCKLAEVDKPTGMRNHVMTTIATLIGNIGITSTNGNILYHQPIRVPIASLIQKCHALYALGTSTVPPASIHTYSVDLIEGSAKQNPNQVKTEEVQNFLNLVFAVTNQCKQDPNLLATFKTDQNCILLDIFIDASLSRYHLVFDEYNKISLAINTLIHLLIQEDLDAPNSGYNSIQKIVPTYPKNITNYLSHLLIYYVKNFNTFSSPTTNSTPSFQNTKPGIGLGKVINLIESMINAIDAEAKEGSKWRDLSSALRSEFEYTFLGSILGPALLQPSEKEVINHIKILIDLVSWLQRQAPQKHDLGRVLLSFIVGISNSSESNNEKSSGATGVKVVRSTMIRRIDALSEPLSVETMKLMDAILFCDFYEGSKKWGSFGKEIRKELLLSSSQIAQLHLLPELRRRHRYNVSSQTSVTPEQVDKEVSAFLSLSPTPTNPNSYEQYLSDARSLIHFNKQIITETIAEANSNKESTEGDSNNGNLLEEDDEEEGDKEGVVGVVIDKMERWIENSVEGNIMVTGIVNKILVLGGKAAEVLMEGVGRESGMKEGERSMWEVMKGVSEEMKRRIKREDGRVEEKKRVRGELERWADGEQGVKGAQKGKEVRNGFWEQVVLFEEFCTELGAVRRASFAELNGKQ
eukprot:TRINITY_DN26412_c0_g1_i1.p1 TRINITY_DN26412_c0_g1~~TRINITY_DN26412_c0_g1_i1.p1  ORF type:complete len:719 (-),score=188.21 TRINITY_DN26412_c0_g1_i1:33-2189(-)